jgi:hypothetical protein
MELCPDDITILIGVKYGCSWEIMVHGVEEHGKYRHEDEQYDHVYLL